MFAFILFILIIAGYVIAFDKAQNFASMKNVKVSVWLTKLHFTALFFFWLNTYFFYYHNFDLRGRLAETILFWLVFFSGFFAAALAMLKNLPVSLQLYFRLVRSWPIVIVCSFFTPLVSIMFWLLFFGFDMEPNLCEDEKCRVTNEYQGILGTAHSDLEVYVYEGLWERRYSFPLQTSVYNRNNIRVTHPDKDELLIQITHNPDYAMNDGQVIDSIFISGDKSTCNFCYDRNMLYDSERYRH